MIRCTGISGGGSSTGIAAATALRRHYYSASHDTILNSHIIGARPLMVANGGGNVLECGTSSA